MKWVNFVDYYPKKNGQYVGRDKQNWKFLLSYYTGVDGFKQYLEGKGWENIEVCCDKFEWLDEQE